MAAFIGGSNNTILSTTWANKPASYPVGQTVFMSNVGPKGSHWFYDGTRWKPVSGSVVLATLDSASSAIGNTETIVLQYQMPANLLQTGDRLRFYLSETKNGATDTGAISVRVGTAGTTGDTLIASKNLLSNAAYLQGSVIFDCRLESATSLMMLPSSRANIGYATIPNTVALDAAVTISSAAANSLYVNVGISSGATNTVQLVDGQIQLISKAN